MDRRTNQSKVIKTIYTKIRIQRVRHLIFALFSCLVFICIYDDYFLFIHPCAKSYNVHYYWRSIADISISLIFFLGLSVGLCKPFFTHLVIDIHLAWCLKWINTNTSNAKNESSFGIHEQKKAYLATELCIYTFRSAYCGRLIYTLLLIWSSNVSNGNNNNAICMDFFSGWDEMEFVGSAAFSDPCLILWWKRSKQCRIDHMQHFINWVEY